MAKGHPRSAAGTAGEDMTPQPDESLPMRVDISHLSVQLFFLDGKSTLQPVMREQQRLFPETANEEPR